MRFRRVLTFLALFHLLSLGNSFADPGGNRYLGTGSCSSSACHGGTQPKNGGSILQNEYVTWSKFDAHSKAWSVLTSADSKKIAAHLGIQDPSHETLCLSCHSTNVPDSKKRGEKYVLEDGVSCESCHGAAEGWIRQHTESGQSHEK